ncbi:MAG: manganese efflux pump MntP family protein [Phycisphaerae bacterium]|nr:manganese efflux pump MntP family protein [Phycisphaerae bacterium]
MHLHDVLAVAVGLGMDAMSVSAAIGVKWHGPGQTFRLAWHMGLFQFAMPILGWSAGQQLADLLEHFGSYVAAALVFAVGVKMLYEALRRRPGEVEEKVEQRTEQFVEKVAHVRAKDPTKGWSLIVLSVATSLDALVVGFSLGIKGEGSIWLVSLVIGVVAAGMSLTGVLVGRRVGKALGPLAETVGALVLMGLAVSFLLL